MTREILNQNAIKETAPEYKYFEGVDIQWNKVPWIFDHQELGKVSIDTYSIWNPAHHPEIADRLAKGERCALYMMGTFGVGEFFIPQEQADHKILDEIKQRDRTQNLVVFAYPEDTRDFVDFERLPQALRFLKQSEKRLVIYPGPMHAIFPAKAGQMPTPDLVREEDQSAAFFWIPGHWGYENLVAEMKKRVSKGLFGGGSLNIHGQEPSFTTADLRDREMVRHPEWLENIDFVILDEISEASNIGRSHTQVSFMREKPLGIRRGSLSPQKIALETGLELEVDEARKPASSKTPYDTLHNAEADRKVEFALSRIARFKNRISHI